MHKLAFVLTIALLAATACTRDERERATPSTVTTPVATTVPAAAATPVAPSPGTPMADVAASPGAEEPEWDLADEAEGPEFEIDAAATAFYGPAPMTIGFKAKALNGTAPFTFTWDFGDGSPKEAGEEVHHRYALVGTFTVTVVGEDSTGAQSRVTLILRTATPQEFVERMHLDPELVKKYPSPVFAPTPIATATPVRG